MRDPIPAPALLVELTKPLADKLSLSTLPYHSHEIVLSCLFYHFIQNYLSPTLSRIICPKTYNGFNKRTRLNWDIHWVSMIQAIFMNFLALYVIFNDDDRKQMDWKDRLWGYTPPIGMVQGFVAGYFLWDIHTCTQYFSLCGPGALLHAIGALSITLIGFRPFGNYYGLSFILYELSTPFLNIHWFCDKLSLTGSNLQFYNGIVLLITFFACRLVWGTYQSVLIYSDIYTALTTSPTSPLASMLDVEVCGPGKVGSGDEGGSCEIGDLPAWLVSVYLVGNTALSLLNLYWFWQMIKAIRKRFVAHPEGAAKGQEKKAQ